MSELLDDINEQRSVMLRVSTGGYNAIDSLNEAYKERRLRIRRALDELSIPDPNPHFDLWRWYDKWSSGDLPNYHSRRRYISDIYDPLEEAIKQIEERTEVTINFEPTGWARVDRNIDNMREALAKATTEEEFQSVGLLCRETMISVAQEVFIPEKHPTLDGIPASETDSKRMLDAYISEELAGSSNEETRRYARASIKLADRLVHDRTAIFRDASLCAEATTATVNLISIISGRRDPQ